MRRGFLLMLLCLVVDSAVAQYFPVGSPIISHFAKADYRAGTQNWAIAQDQRGIIYFGNNKGLLKFDGTKWHIFSLPNQTIVRSVAIGTDGRIYVGGQDEFGYLLSDALGNKKYVTLTDQIPAEQQSFADVWKTFALEDRVYFCSQRAIFSLENGQISSTTPDSKFENFFVSEGLFYVQENGKGLLKWEAGRLTPIAGGEQFADDRITAILPYTDQQTLIVSASKGLFLMSESEIRSWPVAINTFLTANRAYCATRLSDGKFAIGTAQAGVLIIDETGTPVLHLDQENGLQNNTVLSIYQDMQKNLWLGLDNGIDYVETSAPFSLIGKEEGVEGTGYVSIVHEDQLYLGTNQGLYRLDWPRSNNPFIAEPFQAVEGVAGQVWGIQEWDKKLLVGLHEGAYQIKNGEALPLSNAEGAWSFLQLDQHPDFVIEGTYSGLQLYQKVASSESTAAPDLVFIKKLAGFSESARVLEQDSEGHIWVSHAYKGLYKIKIDLDRQEIESVSFYNTQHGLPSNININVVKIRNTLLFTTPRGIFKYDAQTDRFTPDADMNSIFGPQAHVHRLIEDQTGNIWFSVDQTFGLLRVNPNGIQNQIEKIYFNQLQDKIKSGFEHVYAYDSHNIFIATEDGFIHYDPSRKKDFEIPFQTIINQVTSIVKGDSVLLGGVVTYADSLSEQKETFSFPANFNDFRFSFSSPFFEQINHIEYRYRLEGFQELWSDWSPLTEKEYTNLPPGQYRFWAQARNAYGQISRSDSFSFLIQPPWTERWWAKVLFGALFVGFLVALFWHVQRRSSKEQQNLKQAQAKKLQQKEVEYQKEVEKSEAEIIRLRNDKLRGEIKHRDSQLAASTMHLVQKGEMLNNIKQELNKILVNAGPENKKQLKKLIRTIIEDARLDDNWKQFEFYFDQVHENFFRRLRENYPVLTPKDQKLCAYLRMNLSTKEIAPLMNISVRGVEISRYRLRKKMQLDSDTNLIDFMQKI